MHRQQIMSCAVNPCNLYVPVCMWVLQNSPLCFQSVTGRLVAVSRRLLCTNGENENNSVGEGLFIIAAALS